MLVYYKRTRKAIHGARPPDRSTKLAVFHICNKAQITQPHTKTSRVSDALGQVQGVQKGVQVHPLNSNFNLYYTLDNLDSGFNLHLHHSP